MEIKVLKNIMHANQQIAEDNRKSFSEKHITVINVMASPGAGKTSTILKIIDTLKDKVGLGVIEGDIASSIDAEKVDALGIPVIQINTGGGCHLDANMIKTVMPDLKIQDNSIVFIENVGNLVCPSTFDLGESIKMVIASVPEGHDKPFKYTSMFEAADIIVLNKTDLMPYIDFDKDMFYKGVQALSQKATVIEVSCRTGEGVDSLVDWLIERHNSAS
ncbi:MAG TPA: hydrogenase nickel incorporation protein HypB [Pseudobacteroides sp.]|uniref:hydrogenase nickel incorporation protein HypB n=1 Tax=Pseudobacteroides sp. TaxID=1968840 RepID=UPI002F91CEFC